MQVKKLESDMEQWTGSKLGKEYIKAVYCHPAYLTYMQSISCEISRVIIYGLDVLLSQFGTSLLFHVQFELLLLALHTDFSGGR